MDLLVEDRVTVELKTVDAFNDVHFAQVLTHLRFGNKKNWLAHQLQCQEFKRWN